MHRLDRETSGILLVAKKRSALTHLQDQFRERGRAKPLALVIGAWPANKKVIDRRCTGAQQPDGERRVRTTTADDPTACAPSRW